MPLTKIPDTTIPESVDISQITTLWVDDVAARLVYTIRGTDVRHSSHIRDEAARHAAYKFIIARSQSVSEG